MRVTRSSGRCGATFLMLRSKAIARRETGVLPNAMCPCVSKHAPTSRRVRAIWSVLRDAPAWGEAPQDEVVICAHELVSQCRVGGAGCGAEGLGHGGVGEPLIVLADEVALLRGEALALEQGLGDVARFRGQALRAARLGEPGQCIDERSADALMSELGIDEQHVDLLAALEAGEPGDRPVDHGEQGQRARKPGDESLFVVGPRRPSLALVGVVILGRQFLDA